MRVSRRALFRCAAGIAALGLFPAPYAFAQQETESSVTQRVGTFRGRLDGASRSFAPSAVRLIGTSFISTFVVTYNTKVNVAAAFPWLTDYRLDFLFRNQAQAVSETLRQASAPDLGDEAVAYVGDFVDSANPDITYVLGFIAWREKAIIYQNVGLSRETGPLPDLFAVASNITGRELNGDPVSTPTSPQDMHIGGIWDLLPTLADVPEGFVFVEDETQI